MCWEQVCRCAVLPCAVLPPHEESLQRSVKLWKFPTDLPVSALLVSSTLLKRLRSVQDMARKAIHVDLPRGKEVVLDRLGDCLCGGAPGDIAPTSPSRGSVCALTSIVLSRDVQSNGVVLCCAVLFSTVLPCAAENGVAGV
jgi:hypothetical protein